MFAGALCYADDIVILAPCASALRLVLDICSLYAHDHGLLFNASTTQLCFHSCKNRRFLPLNNTGSHIRMKSYILDMCCPLT
ncbi:hypothetical protein GBAR_LOCUS26984 [Geodia barretti]|uniref:Reverse transcriptase domain-containing protein n=1 Tax=Geodia barretti TaxID=519541 RepID=A0AA35TK05_GEOBA|nr:hypothetical protein GBAR_LOCUS26984 [Geodia barretti]